MSETFDLACPVAPWKARPKESPVNGYIKACAKERGWKAVRVVKASENHLPDWLIQTSNGLHFWVEAKRKDGTARRAQQLRHEELRESGVSVFVVDDEPSVREVFYAL